MSKLRITLLFLCVAGLVGWWIMHFEPSDMEELKQIVQESNGHVREGGLTTYCQQLREGVEKELFHRENVTKRISIKSRESELYLFKKEKDVEVIEELSHVVCVAQEKLFVSKEGKPKQIVQTIEADRATYDYTTSILTAKDATLKKYELSGHALPPLPTQNPLMVGKAKDVTITVKEDDYDVSVKGLRLVLEE